MSTGIRNAISKVAMIVVAACLIITSQTMISHADPNSVSLEKSTKVTVQKGEGCWVKIGSQLSNADKVTVKSDNNKIIKPIKYDRELYPEYVGYVAKKTGKAKLTVTMKKDGTTKQFKCTITVVKRTNPFGTLKIAGKDIKSELNDSFVTRIKNKKSGKQTITVKPANGWKIKSIEYTRYDLKTEKSYDKKIKGESGKVELKKSSERYEQCLHITVYNSKLYNKGVRHCQIFI